MIPIPPPPRVRPPLYRRRPWVREEGSDIQPDLPQPQELTVSASRETGAARPPIG